MDFTNRGNTREHMGNILNSRVQGGTEGTDSARTIQIASLNIMSDQAGGIEAALRALHKKCWDRCPTGDKYDWRDPHVIYCGLQSMGDGGRDPPHSQYHHCLERGYGKTITGKGD